MNITSNIKHIYYGKEDEINDGKRLTYKTSYKKKPIKNQEILMINELGFIEDNQSDTLHHGGIDKAICVYSQKYYHFFREKYNLDLPNCAFGENFTIEDLDDSNVCVGDKFQCGDVLFEVSQPRQPCWKISSVLNIKNLTSLIVKESKTGFYLRVLNNGCINAKDKLELVSRDYKKLTIEYINQCSFNAKNNQENIKEILMCDKLATAYKLSLSKRYQNKEEGINDWQNDNYQG